MTTNYAINIKKRKKQLRNDVSLHIMLFPGVILSLLFLYLPMFGILLAFRSYDYVAGVLSGDWIGFENFTYIFKLPLFITVLKNTVLIAFGKIVLAFFIPILVSLLLNEMNKGIFKSSVQIFIYLPHFLSWVILAGVFMDLLDPNFGLLNNLLVGIGLKPVEFLTDPKIFPWTLIFTDTWKEFGYGTIVYISALTAISPELYEAAKVDGANKLQQTFHITLPGLIPMMALMLTLSLGNVLNAGFDQVYNLYSIPVRSTGEIIDTLIYRMSLKEKQHAVGIAMGLFKSVISTIFIITGYKLAKKFADYDIF